MTFADSEGELASMFGDIKDKVAASDVVESYKSYLSDKRSGKAMSLFFFLLTRIPSSSTSPSLIKGITLTSRRML